jgi:uncharacterized cupredoxin-like copper-binding protein
LLLVSALSSVAVLLAPGASRAPAGIAATDRTTASVVSVVMKDRSFALSVRAVAAGKVTFVVRNAGTMKHEFVVIRTNAAARALPMKGNQASEAGAKGEIEGVQPGATKRLTLTLAPGKYVVICNLPGHYKKGQYAALVVAAGSGSSGTPQTTEVSVSAFEMGFKLSKTTVPFGTVVFTVKNDGKVDHDFSFGSRGGGTTLLRPGESAKLTVSFPKPGISKYTFICTVEGHYSAGMSGTLTVKP